MHYIRYMQTGITYYIKMIFFFCKPLGSGGAVVYNFQCLFTASISWTEIVSFR